MVTTSDGSSFAAADLPGLIEGASQGVGLGTQFLTSYRKNTGNFTCDRYESDGRTRAMKTILPSTKELLASHNLRLLERPQIIVANKMDMPDAPENLVRIQKNS